MTEAIRVVVVADNLLARAGLAALLANQEDCLVVGQIAGDGVADALALMQPDVLLVDMGWQVAHRLDTLATIAQHEIPVVTLISDESDAAAVMGALSAAALYGLLLNENEPDMLLLALQAVTGGLIVLDPALSDHVLAAQAARKPLPEALTSRENDVLQRLAQGLTNKAIAHQLGITDHTVKFHVNAIMTKLGAQSRTEAVVLATRAGLIIL